MNPVHGNPTFFHDSRAELVADGDITVAWQEECYARLPEHALTYLLDETGFFPDQPNSLT